MKIDTKKAGLAATSFLCGFLLCAAILSHSPAQRRLDSVVANAPMLAFTQVQRQTSPVIWIVPPEWTSPGVTRVERDPLLDQMQSVPGQRPAHNVDLIDTRYQVPVDLPEFP